MADEFQLGNNGNWWDSSKTRFHIPPAPPPSTTLNTTAIFTWPIETVDIRARSCMDNSISVSNSTMVFAESPKLQSHGYSSNSGLLTDPNLPFMGLGISSQGIDWNQPLFPDEKAHESGSFRTMNEEGMSLNTNFQQDSEITSSHQDQWRQKIYTASSDDSSVNDSKQMNHQGFSLDQQQLITSQMDSSLYGNPVMLPGLLSSGNNNHPQQSNFDNRAINYSYPPNYEMNNSEFHQIFRANSPPKQQLQLSNSTPFWNSSSPTMINDVQSSFLPSIQEKPQTQTFQEKKQKKNTLEVRSGTKVVKKTSSKTSTKRSRDDETTSPKVKKEKMADRVTALQQLVSPFGKTDTASVLSEAFEYIKFLHGQVSALSTPYMKSGASIQHHQLYDKSKDEEGKKQDLRSRGLCFVPISSTFPFNRETTVDFWTPSFGGTFR